MGPFSENRRANVARDTRASPASDCTVHARAGSSCNARSATPTTGSLLARYHGGAQDPGRANHSRSVDS
ncbi:MAG: hypothetical protein KY432_00205, partial [Acidobacteria bacterium]|nr:hypothetical protein [Acidobacteriota bacterium]